MIPVECRRQKKEIGFLPELVSLRQFEFGLKESLHFELQLMTAHPPGIVVTSSFYLDQSLFS